MKVITSVRYGECTDAIVPHIRDSYLLGDQKKIGVKVLGQYEIEYQIPTKDVRASFVT